MERPPFVPRSKQRPFLYCFDQEMYQLYVLLWHRRYGKDRTFLNAAGAKARDKGWPIWHGFPDAIQARRRFWNATTPDGKRIIDDMAPFTSRMNDQTMTMWFPSGGVYEVIGYDRYDSQVGGGPKVIGYSEFSIGDPMARTIFRPMVAANRGAEVFMYTMRGDNHGARLAELARSRCPKDAFFSELNIDQTYKDAPGEEGYGLPVVGPDQVERDRADYKATNGRFGMSEDAIQQEYYNSPLGINAGKVYGKEMSWLRRNGRITNVPHDPYLGVHTSWDRGVHNRVMMWQQKGPARYFIDHLSTDNSDPRAIADLMREGDRAKYNYVAHWGGRDILDPVPGVPHSYQAMLAEVGFRKGGHFNAPLQPAPYLSVITGINAVKAMLPRSWWDAEKCDAVLNSMGEYEWAKDKQFGTLTEPKDRQLAAHDCDAVRYMAVSERDERQKPPDGENIRLGRGLGRGTWMGS